MLEISGMMFKNPQSEWDRWCPGVTPDEGDSRLVGWAPNPVAQPRLGAKLALRGSSVAFEQGMGAQNCSSDVAGAAQLEPRSP